MLPLLVQQKVNIPQGPWATNLLIRSVLLNTEVKLPYLYDSTKGLFNLGRLKWAPLIQVQIVDDDSMQCHAFAWGGMGTGCQEASKVQQPSASYHPCSEPTDPVDKKGEDDSWSTPLVASKCDGLIRASHC